VGRPFVWTSAAIAPRGPVHLADEALIRCSLSFAGPPRFPSRARRTTPYRNCAALTQISIAFLPQKQRGCGGSFRLRDADCQSFRAGVILTEDANAFLPERAARLLWPD
jgi:hypothetical protein